MSRTIYNPDGTLTGSALADTILWTERRGLNLVDLSTELGTDPKELGVALQRAKAGGAYMAKRKELIENGMLKVDKPISPKPEEQKPQPPAESKPKPSSSALASGKERRELAKKLMEKGATAEEAAKAAGYKSAKIMLRALSQTRAPVPPEEKQALRVKCLAPAYLGDDHVYVLGAQGLDVLPISDAGFIPWAELEEVMTIRKGAVK